MTDIQYTSVLTADYRKDLENLLFFNPEQKRFRSDIVRSIERCGCPEIVMRNGHLHVGVTKYLDAQNLFALMSDRQHPRLVGSIIYFRESRANLVVAHVAVVPPYTMLQSRGEVPLALELLNHVMVVAQRVKGIETVELPYSRGKPRRIPIAGGPEWIALMATYRRLT